MSALSPIADTLTCGIRSMRHRRFAPLNSLRLPFQWPVPECTNYWNRNNGRPVASIGPQNNFSAFRARSSNYELKEVYLARNCSSQCLIKRKRQTSVESL